MHPPIRVAKRYEGSDFDEDKTTKEMMAAHGIDNVRGGTYSSLQLGDAQVKTLELEINSASDRCFLCGSKTHFANGCNKRVTAGTSTTAYTRRDGCSRCGRQSHIAEHCYASTRIDGCELPYSSSSGSEDSIDGDSSSGDDEYW